MCNCLKTGSPLWDIVFQFNEKLIFVHRDKLIVSLEFDSWEAKFRSVSLRLGYIGNTCWAFLFFPVTRGSTLLPLVGLTSESSIKYHIWLGHLSNTLFFAHSVGFFIYWAMTNQMVEVCDNSFHQIVQTPCSCDGNHLYTINHLYFRHWSGAAHTYPMLREWLHSRCH